MVVVGLLAVSGEGSGDIVSEQKYDCPSVQTAWQSLDGAAVVLRRTMSQIELEGSGTVTEPIEGRSRDWLSFARKLVVQFRTMRIA